MRMMPAALESSHELAGDERAAQPDKSPKPLAVLEEKKKSNPCFKRSAGMACSFAEQSRREEREKREYLWFESGWEGAYTL